MGDIFISYAREDISVAEKLAKEFESKGWSVFWDRTIPPGKTWRDVIGEALNKAKCVVVLWSQHSVKSNWVITEADFGLNRNILVPVFIESVDPPLGFGNIQAGDLIGWKKERDHHGFIGLIEAVQELVDLPEHSAIKKKITDNNIKPNPAKSETKKKTNKSNKTETNNLSASKSTIGITEETQISLGNKKNITKSLMIGGIFLSIIVAIAIIINLNSGSRSTSYKTDTQKTSYTATKPSPSLKPTESFEHKSFISSIPVNDPNYDYFRIDVLFDVIKETKWYNDKITKINNKDDLKSLYSEMQKGFIPVVISVEERWKSEVHNLSSEHQQLFRKFMLEIKDLNNELEYKTEALRADQ